MITELKFNSHEEWLSIRHKYIGGSDAGAIVGLNPYKSAYTLWCEKTDRITGFEGNLTTEVGAYLEEFVAKQFEREAGKKVRRKNFTMVNDLYPFACANVDRVVVGENSIVEIKTTNSFPVMKMLRSSDEFPECYYAQCVHYLAVTGYERVYLAVLINCREFKIFTLERDEAEIQALMGAEEEFWGYVKNNTPPPVDGSDSTSETLGTVYAGGNKTDDIDLSLFEIELEQIKSLNAQIKEYTDIKDEIINKIKSYMGNIEKGSAPSFKVSWATGTKRTFDSKKFTKEHPEFDVEVYHKVTPTRTFRITEISMA